MLLWCAFVNRSIRPTRSVVDTPCVRLHSLLTKTAFLTTVTPIPGSKFSGVPQVYVWGPLDFTYIGPFSSPLRRYPSRPRSMWCHLAKYMKLFQIQFHFAYISTMLCFKGRHFNVKITMPRHLRPVSHQGW